MKKRIVAIPVCILLIISSLVIVSPSIALKVSGNTLYVGGDGSGNYTRIQDAVDNASFGDTVFVYSGTYNENIIVDKTIFLIGEEKENTIIDGNKTDDVIKIISNNVIINGFTIKNSGNDHDPEDTLNSDSGIDIQSDFVTISNNIIANNLIGLSTRGISSKNNLIIKDNLFIYNNENEKKDNLAVDCYGCYLMYTDYSKIFNNEFYYNDNAIRISYSDNNEITNNKIINLTSNNAYGIYIKTSNFNIFSNNYIKNTSVGIWIYSLADLIIGNIICNNTIMESFDALLMQFCSSNYIFGNLIINNDNGINLKYSTYNNFYHNDFINNIENAYDDMINFWYNTVSDEGNFWDDYTGEDADQNGVGDTPYNIAGGSNQDKYPLIKPKHNIAPEKPTIIGKSSGKPGTEYEYKFISTDLNGDEISYYVDWGDNKYTGWTRTLPSGEYYNSSHTWSVKGNYTIRAKAKDTSGAESDWTSLELSMPKSKAKSLNVFLQRFFQRFPFFEKILKQITIYPK